MMRSTSRLNLPARSTAPLEAQFRFSDGVYKVLRNPGELRIHYSSRVDAGVHVSLPLAGLSRRIEKSPECRNRDRWDEKVDPSITDGVKLPLINALDGVRIESHLAPRHDLLLLCHLYHPLMEVLNPSTQESISFCESVRNLVRPTASGSDDCSTLQFSAVSDAQQKELSLDFLRQEVASPGTRQVYLVVPDHEKQVAELRVYDVLP